MSEKIYIVDGSGYIFRAYYAIAPLKTKEGFPTNALYGFTKMLIKLFKEAESENIVMVFDAGRETFRNEIYPEYKANRDECPADLLPQMPYFREISKALGLKVLELPGYEADDVIGTYVECLKDSELEVVVISGDKDLMQLVNKKVSIWDTMKDKVYDIEGVKEKMGVYPEKITELLALMGDSSDNIPGVTGVGPKTAIALIESYGDSESIINSTQEIKENKAIRGRIKISERIEEDPEILRLSRKLVEIKRDSPVLLESGEGVVEIKNLDTTELVDFSKRFPFDEEMIATLVEKFQFNSLFKDLDSVKSIPTNNSYNFNFQLIDESNFDAWLEKFLSVENFAFDVETTSLDPLEAKLVGIAICWEDDTSYYIPFAHKDKSKKQLSLEKFIQKTKDHFRNSEIKKIGQNLKYDVSVLKQQGLEVNGVSFDTMIAAYLLHPDSGGYSLTNLSREHLAYRMSEYENVVSKEEDFSDVLLEEAKNYAAEDAICTWLLKAKLEPLLEENELLEVFQKIEIPLITVLADMELAGIELDKDFLTGMSKHLENSLEAVTSLIYHEAGSEFNINSPKQLSEVLFTKMEIPTKGIKKTKTSFSTNVVTLEKLKPDYKIAELLLDYRMLFKLKSTYVDALPAQISPVTNRLHTQFNQTVTGTGRLSSSSPNLQNIPIQKPEGREVRKGFVASSKKILISADYSQIELRILAHMSNDESLIEAFMNNEDIHAKTAREIFDIPQDEEIEVDKRRHGKTINFGIIYGISPFRLARDLEVPFYVAEEYINAYFAKYSGVKTFFDSLEQQAVQDGFVKTMWGRRRNLNELEDRSRDKGFLRRVAVNAPIQGTAADVIKLAMIDIQNRIIRDKLPLKMLLQIHDELVFEADENSYEDMIHYIKEDMECIGRFQVPLKVDVGFGKNWEVAH